MPPRFFRHGELPLVLLALVAQAPRHRYELMAELTRLFGPRYRASPGSVYPAIEALYEEGLITGDVVGDRPEYRTTPAGDQALTDRAETLAALELRTGVRLSRDESLDALLTRFKARLTPLDGRVDLAGASAVLDRAAGAIELLASTQEPARRARHAARRRRAG